MRGGEGQTVESDCVTQTHNSHIRTAVYLTSCLWECEFVCVQRFSLGRISASVNLVC